MEKTFKSSDERDIGYGPAYVIRGEAPDHLVYRLLTIIEAMGLPATQEKSVKDLVKQEIYSSLGLETWINGQLHTIIKEMGEWFGSGSSGSVPVPSESHGFMSGEYTLTCKLNK